MAGLNLPTTDEPINWLSEAFAQRLAHTLELMTGEMPQVGWRASEAAELAGELLWWEQPLSLAGGAVLWIGAPEPSWLEIGTHVLRAAGIQQSEPAEARNTCLEIIGQAFSGLARDISARMRREVHCQPGSEVSAPPAIESLTVVDLTLAAGQPLSLWLAPASGLLESLVRTLEPPESPEPSVPAPAAETAEGPRLPAPPLLREPPGGQNQKTLDLLMEVEMPVSVSFGRAELPLRDVLKLTTGSIIELNRTVSEPVEVIVNNCVIARGEVVVIEGNYGVRIQEIISRQERLRTLK